MKLEFSQLTLFNLAIIWNVKSKYPTFILRDTEFAFIYIYIHCSLFRGLCCRTVPLVVQAKDLSWTTI